MPQPRMTSAQRYGLVGVIAVTVAGVAITPRESPQDSPQAQHGQAVVAGETIFANGFEGEGSGGGPVPPVNACPEPPAGWYRVNKSWGDLFSPNGWTPRRAEFASQSGPVPIPFLQGRDQYSVTEFQVTKPNQYVGLYVDQVQSKAPWYTMPRPAKAIYVVLSDCAGDARPPGSYQDPNTFMRPGCRFYANTGTLSFGTMPGVGCPVVQGQTVYLHFIPADPEGGITPGESSCEKPAGGCDVGVITGN